MSIHRLVARLKEIAAWPEDFYTLICRVGKPVKFIESSSPTIRGTYSFKGPDTEHKGSVTIVYRKIAGAHAKVYKLESTKGNLDKDLISAVAATVKEVAKRTGVTFITKGWHETEDPKVTLAVVSGNLNIIYSGSDYPSKKKIKADVLDTEERKALPKSEFGLPDERSYPMPDAAHAKNAKARAKQQLDKGNLSQAEYDKIVRKADSILGK